MSGIWNMSIWNVILHKKEGTGLIFSTVPLVEAAHSRDIATFVKKSLFTAEILCVYDLDPTGAVCFNVSCLLIG